MGRVRWGSTIVFGIVFSSYSRARICHSEERADAVYPRDEESLLCTVATWNNTGIFSMFLESLSRNRVFSEKPGFLLPFIEMILMINARGI
jgi:hypothetical protein